MEGPRYGIRLGLLLWAAGMLGVAAFAAGALPGLVAEQGGALPLPLWALALLSALQTGGLLALAVWAGTALTPRVSLRAPAFEALAAGRSPLAGLRPQLAPGGVGAVLGLAVFAAAAHTHPTGHAAAAPSELPLAVRLLYGGVTEELLLRWGLMTLLLWLAWRFLQRSAGPPRAPLAWLAIAVSAVLFGVGHLPFAAVQGGGLATGVVAWVVGFNAAFGLVFGYLFWRHGLEAAIVAHAGAHLLNHVAGA